MTRLQSEILSAAMALSPEERAKLADELLKSLDDAEQALIDQAWADEAEHRIDEIESGKAVLLPGDEVMANLHHR